MQCSEIRELLSAYIDGVLDGQESQAVKNHLQNCDACSRELTDLHKTIELLHNLGEVRPPEDFRPQVIARLATANSSGKPGQAAWQRIMGRFPGTWQRITAAVLIVGLGLGAGLYSLAQLRMGSKAPDIALNTGQTTAQSGSEQKTSTPAETPASLADQRKSGTGSGSATELPELGKMKMDRDTARSSTEQPNNIEKGVTGSTLPSGEENRQQKKETLQAGDKTNGVPGPGTGNQTNEIPGSSSYQALSPVSPEGSSGTNSGGDVTQDKGLTTLQAPQSAPPPAGLAGDTTTGLPGDTTTGQAGNANVTNEVNNQVESVPGSGDSVGGAGGTGTPQVADQLRVSSSTVPGPVTGESNAVSPPVNPNARKSSANTKVEAAKKSASAETKSQDSAGIDNSRVAVDTPAQGQGPESSPAVDSKIVRDGTLSLEVENYKEFGAKLPGIIDRYAGYIEKSSENTGDYVTASFVIRVPARSFNDLITQIESMGSVTGKQITGRDATGEFIDAEARLRNLERQEQRLLGLMDKTGTVSDMLSTESELSRIRGEIEVLQGRLKVLDNAIIYSTITLEVRELAKSKVAPVQGVFGKTVRNFNNSVAAILNLAGDLLALTGWLLPWLLSLAAVGGAAYYYRRKTNRDK